MTAVIADEKTTTPAPAPTEATDASSASTAAGSEVTTLKAELAALGEQVAHMADTVLADVPERFRSLIPESLSPAAQAAWVLKARKAGLFGPVAVVETDAGRKPTITPKTADFNSLPAHERIKAGYLH